MTSRDLFLYAKVDFLDFFSVGKFFLISGPIACLTISGEKSYSNPDRQKDRWKAMNNASSDAGEE